MIFTNEMINIQINKYILKLVKHYKFLGVIFDNKLD